MITDQLANAVRVALTSLNVDPIPTDISVERPARPEHGDWSTNVALATAKNAGRNPRELGLELAAALNADLPAHVTEVDVAGPGFVNFHLSDSWLHDVLANVIDLGVDDYGRLDFGGDEKVLIEFVSANPTGPLHAAHGRGAVYGDSLARIMARCGFDVGKENYLNDRGVQMEKFAASLTARKTGGEPPEGGYMGQYIIDWAAEMPDDADALEWGRERALASHAETLGALNVTFDRWFSERSLLETDAIEQTLADLGDHVFDDDGALWLRSTEFGDDKDRVLRKSDGDYTYLAPDIAYHRDKFERGHERLIDVWGADHHGYIARMRAGLQALGHDADAFEVPIVQMVSLMREGEEVRISKRTGDMIELSEIVDEVGPDAARLTYLLQSLDSQQTFDFDVVTSQAMENPVHYIHYAHARIHSMARQAAERGVVRAPIDQVDLSLLIHERELDVLRSLFELPNMVRLACVDRAPHKITTWVRELAGAFHGFYHDCRVLGTDNIEVDPALTQARLWLIESARVGLSIAFDLLGVSAPEEM